VALREAYGASSGGTSDKERLSPILEKCRTLTRSRSGPELRAGRVMAEILGTLVLLVYLREHPEELRPATL